MKPRYIEFTFEWADSRCYGSINVEAWCQGHQRIVGFPNQGAAHGEQPSNSASAHHYCKPSIWQPWRAPKGSTKWTKKYGVHILHWDNSLNLQHFQLVWHGPLQSPYPYIIAASCHQAEGIGGLHWLMKFISLDCSLWCYLICLLLEVGRTINSQVSLNNDMPTFTNIKQHGTNVCLVKGTQSHPMPLSTTRQHLLGL